MVMKHIKLFENWKNSLIDEALRDTWKKSLRFQNPKEKKYFSKYWSDEIYEKILKDLLKFFTQSEPDWIDGYKEDFESQYYDEDEYRSETSFWRKIETKRMYLDYLDDVFRDRLTNLSNFLDDNRIDDLVIYRNIMVNRIWLDLFLNKENDEVHLGEYWAYDKNLAEPHWGYNNGDKNIEVQFQAKCEMMDINLWKTFVSALENEDEAEIALFPNTPLELVSITIDGKEVDLSNFKNKEIYA
jgi:hypothetical protein